MNTKLHAVTDVNGRPLSFFMTAARSAIIPVQPRCSTIFPRRNGCWATAATTPTGSGMRFQEKGIKPCIPGGEIPS